MFDFFLFSDLHPAHISSSEKVSAKQPSSLSLFSHFVCNRHIINLCLYWMLIGPNRVFASLWMRTVSDVAAVMEGRDTRQQQAGRITTQAGKSSCCSFERQQTLAPSFQSVKCSKISITCREWWLDRNSLNRRKKIRFCASCVKMYFDYRNFVEELFVSTTRTRVWS